MSNYDPETAWGGGIQVVNLMTWDNGRIGMGHRTRRQAEHCQIWQKPPIRAKTTWRDHRIPDVWSEQIENRTHTHQKPSGLTRRLIESITEVDDLIVNPCSGSFHTLDVALACGRHFLGRNLKG